MPHYALHYNNYLLGALLHNAAIHKAYRTGFPKVAVGWPIRKHAVSRKCPVGIVRNEGVGIFFTSQCPGTLSVYNCLDPQESILSLYV